MIKIVVYNDTKTVVEEEIRGFANASMAANYRDHDDRLAYKTTVLEQDVREAVYSGNYGDTSMEADGSEGTGVGEADQHRLRVIPETRGERILDRIGLGLLFLVLVFVLYIAVIMIGINIEAALKGW